MTQRRKFQSIGLLVTAVFSAVLLWALATVVWPVPVVYAQDPNAVDDSFTVDEDSVDNSLYVLANDTGEDLTVAAVGTPDQDGTAINGGDVITYTPAADFFGTEVFTYTVRDTGFLTDTATVTVTAVNDPPVANDDTDYSNVATVTITIELTDPVITAITVTSDIPAYFYDPGLGDTGGEVFFNSLPDEGGGQAIPSPSLSVTPTLTVWKGTPPSVILLAPTPLVRPGRYPILLRIMPPRRPTAFSPLPTRLGTPTQPSSPSPRTTLLPLLCSPTSLTPVMIMTLTGVRLRMNWTPTDPTGTTPAISSEVTGLSLLIPVTTGPAWPPARPSGSIPMTKRTSWFVNPMAMVPSTTSVVTTTELST